MDFEIEEHTFELPHLQVQGPRSRELLRQLTDADVAGLKYFRWFPHPIKVGGVDGCYVSRTGYSGELGYEIFVPGREAPSGCGRRCSIQGANMGIRPYGLAAVESLRIEAGLIFIGFDYFPAVTSPFHVNLDRMVKLDKQDFVGKARCRRGGRGHHPSLGHARDRAATRRPTTTRRCSRTGAGSAS